MPSSFTAAVADSVAKLVVKQTDVEEGHRRRSYLYKVAAARYPQSTKYCGMLAKVFLTFDGVMGLCIALNAVALAMDSHLAPAGQKCMLARANLFFTIVFLLELLLKWGGLGLEVYFSDPLHKFDFLIVAVSCVELGLELSTAGTGFFSQLCAVGSSGGSSSTTAFRTIRVVRVFRAFRVAKLMRHMSFMATLVEVLSRAMHSLAFVSLLLLVFCWMFALLGMQLFGGTFNFGKGDLNPSPSAPRSTDDRPRNNFDSMTNAFISVFQVCGAPS
jgi:hypothetical protein